MERYEKRVRSVEEVGQSPPPWSMESAGMAMDRAVEGLQGATRSSAPETLISNGPRG